MNWTTLRTIVFRSFALVAALGAARLSQAQGAKKPYPSMAPIDQYLNCGSECGDNAVTERCPSIRLPGCRDYGLWTGWSRNRG